MRTITRYLLKAMIQNILFVMLALITMFSFFDLIQELELLGKGSYGLEKVILFVLLSAPGHIYEVMPVAVLVGAMYCLGQLARHSELIILRVSGVSIFEIAMTFLKVGLVFSLFTFIVGELVTPLSERTAQRLRIQATESVIAQDFQSGLWIKDGQNFVNVAEIKPDATLLDINIYGFDSQFQLLTINVAKEGHFVENAWHLNDVTRTTFKNNTVQVQAFKKATWRSVIRPELLNVLLVLPEKMSAWNLYAYIRHLSVNKQKTTRYEVALWSKLVYPVACLVMIILALPFGFLQQRATGGSAKIFIGIMLGVFYQILNRVFIHLGLLNDWPPLLSAVLPTILFLIAGLVMLKKAEHG